MITELQVIDSPDGQTKKIGKYKVEDYKNLQECISLELEDGTMINMLAERRYPLSRELMIRMLDHGMEVEDESGG
ncbi:hypothetical protein Tco_0792610 [Tanacetum coccineum]